MFSAHETLVTRIRTLYRSQMSGRHALNLWRTSRDVYSKKFFFCEKNDFFRFFYDFRPFFGHFTKFRARDFQNHKIHDLRSVTHFLPCPYHLSSTFWRKLNLLCKKHVLFCRVNPRKTSFWLIFGHFSAFFRLKTKHFTQHHRKKFFLDV